MASRPLVTIESAVQRGDQLAVVHVGAAKASRFTVADSSGVLAARVAAAFGAAGFHIPTAEVWLRGASPSDVTESPFELAIALAALAADGRALPHDVVARLGAIGSLRADGTVGRSFLLGPMLDVMTAPTVVVPAGHLAIGSPPGRTIVRVESLREAVEALTAREATSNIPTAPPSAPFVLRPAPGDAPAAADRRTEPPVEAPTGRRVRRRVLRAAGAAAAWLVHAPARRRTSRV